MAEYILKDSRGKEQTFADDKIFVQGTDGELVQFTMGSGGAVLENLEVKENGTYTPGDGVDGFGSVVVDVDSTKITILPEQTISGFADEGTGLYGKLDESPTYAISVGKKYSVKWDGIIYGDFTAEYTNPDVPVILLGNKSLIGMESTGEPFLIAYEDGVVNYIAYGDTAESHTIGIWEKVTQEITLQDKTITENGTYTADSGYDGLGSVTVDVAGSGGGIMGEPLKAQGTFVPTSESGAVTIEHNLGMIPDYIIVTANDVDTVGAISYAVGFRNEFPVVDNKQEIMALRDAGLELNTSTNGIEGAYTSILGNFGDANENTVKIGGNFFRLATDVTYTWKAIRFIS